MPQVSAGNQLFHVVVDTDEVATRITGLLAAEKAGRVTFVPLNRVRPSPVAYPTEQGSDAIPLVSKLHYEPAYRNAVHQVRVSTVSWVGVPRGLSAVGTLWSSPFSCTWRGFLEVLGWPSVYNCTVHDSHG